MAIKDNNQNTRAVNQGNYKRVLFDANSLANPFGENRVAEIAYKKAERLVLATHLVTNFVPKNENVRESVRSNSQLLLALTLELRDGLHSTGSNSVNIVIAKVRLILSLLDVIHASGYISSMNLEVLKGAYAEFVDFLVKSKDGHSSDRLELNEEHFLSVTVNSNGQKSKGQNESLKDTNLKDSVKDTKNLKDRKSEDAPRPKSLRAKRKLKSRRMSVLDAVTKNSPAHIKDIAIEVTDCSEKTIQRELVSLVRDGVLKKEGSKRWTTYSLVV